MKNVILSAVTSVAMFFSANGIPSLNTSTPTPAPTSYTSEIYSVTYDDFSAEMDKVLRSVSSDELLYVESMLSYYIISKNVFPDLTVPAGIYKVGYDIPAGRWVIKSTPGNDTIIQIGYELEPDGNSMDILKSKYVSISSEGSSMDDYNDGVRSYVANLTDGMYVSVSVGQAVFSPYMGLSTLQ